MQRRHVLKLLASAPFLFKTQPLWGATGFGSLRPKHISKIAFGSCAHQDYPQPIWSAIAKTNPDLFVFLGDNIYGDTEDMNVLAAKYAQLGANPRFTKFRKRVPVVATWDDHDYGENDSGAEYPMKTESKRLMLDFFGEPKNSVRRRRGGIYTSYLFGERPRRVQVILLDLRWFRSPLKQAPNGTYISNDDPRATLLGREQWRWLERQLLVPADLRILASSIQLVSSDHTWEKWSCFPHEKKRLYRLLDRYKIRNLIAISGDMHFGEISSEKTPHGFSVYDLTSSGLSHYESAADIPNSKRLSLFDTDVNFGFISIDWDANPARVKLEVRNSHGRTAIHKELRYEARSTPRHRTIGGPRMSF